MPELPEVEVVRAGMQRHFAGSRIEDVEVLAPRSIRRNDGGTVVFRDHLIGREISSVDRRGKFLWAPLDGGPEVLVLHLGMSGQILAQSSLDELPAHSRVTLRLATSPHLVFADQRMFGGVHLDSLAESGGRTVPTTVAHIAADPFEPTFDVDAVARVMRTRSAPVKSVLLNQHIVSGIGNIYADEALWRAQVDWARRASSVSLAKMRALLLAAREVMAEAIGAGGTSFDSMYINVNGASGYFSRSLNAYGRSGQPCPRCGTRIIREKFQNRSSFRCPRCQRRAASR